MKRKSGRIVSIVLLGVFCVSVCQLFFYYSTAAGEQGAFARLSQRRAAGADASDTEPETGTGPETAEAAGKGVGAAQGPILPGYAALYEENPDLFGWVRIAGVRLDYPVMHTPGEPEYYLRRAFDKTSSQSGVPFLDASCYEGCGNYLVYGHNMKNGTMFAALLSYADREFWEQHPVISFDTLHEHGEYEVLAAFRSEIGPQDQDNGFRYYRYTDLTHRAVFEEYLSQVQNAALYDTGVAADYGDTLLTLSTCSYHKENGRFVVVARKKAARLPPGP